MFYVELVAIAQCDREADGRGCVITRKFSADAEGTSLESFYQTAQEHFEQQGWRFFGGTRCPQCANSENAAD